MNSKQRATLRVEFTLPVPAAVKRSDIENLLIAAGCERIEGNGSRVRFVCKGSVASFHRPHPWKEAKHYQVRDARDFLKKIGVSP